MTAENEKKETFDFRNQVGIQKALLNFGDYGKLHRIVLYCLLFTAKTGCDAIKNKRHL